MFSAWNDQQTSHFYCKSQDFYPFSWQILVLPALVLSISVSVFPWNRQFQQHRLLCCHRPDDFAGPIVCDRNLWWKIHSLSLVCPHLPISVTSWPLLYTLAFCPFSPSFTKWTNLRPFHFFFVVLKFHSYVCKDVGETSYTDFILKCSLHLIFHISFHPNSIQLLPSKFNQLPCFFIIAALTNLASFSMVRTSLYTSFHLPWTDTAPYFSINVASSPFFWLPHPLSTILMCLNRVSAERWFSCWPFSSCLYFNSCDSHFLLFAVL